MASSVAGPITGRGGVTHYRRGQSLEDWICEICVTRDLVDRKYFRFDTRHCHLQAIALRS